MCWESSCWLNFCNTWDLKREKDMSVVNFTFFVLNHIKIWQFACWAQDKKTQDKADTSVAYIAICAFSQHLITWVVRYHLLCLSHMFELLFSYNSDFLILILFDLLLPVWIFSLSDLSISSQYFLPASQLIMLVNLNVVVCCSLQKNIHTFSSSGEDLT